MPGYDFEKLNHYQILNVARGASLNEIKKAFRQEITTYHPDRYVRASTADKQYARARSQRINEAFRVLRDPKLREHYDVSMAGTPASMLRPNTPVPTGPLIPRDHQAELYDTAQAHIEAGRYIQAVGVLRRLQQINPFYRDVSTLLANTELSINARQMTMPIESIRRTSWLTVSIVVMVGILVGLVWVLSGRNDISGAKVEPTDVAEIGVVDTVTPIITRTPRRTATRTPLPATPTLERNVLLDDTFQTAAWAEATGNTWSTRYADKRYMLQARLGGDAAWSYRPVEQSDIVVTADIEVRGGRGGIMLRYLDESDFVAFVIDPTTQAYALLQRQGTDFIELTAGTFPAIQSGPNASNQLEASVVGQTVIMTINGNVVAEQLVEQIANSARFGMVAIPTSQNAEVAVSRITVRLPPEQ